ncbi:hypothetical protein H9P43_009688 [Blastocladiella emersonii ATCC 22665]|nr:hypothetical protein H9P43_009688 [Blastocladiella emersonii ATCC 22665]
MKKKSKTKGKASRGSGTFSPSPSSAASIEPTMPGPVLLGDDASDPYYPYGQSYLRDLLLYHNPRLAKQFDVLALQHANLRDVAHTIGEAKRKYGTADLNFVLTNTHPEALARDLLVLHAISTAEFANDRVPARFISQLYFSLLLDPEARAFWDAQMRSCLLVNWNRPADRIRVFDDDTLRAVRRCWES